MNTQRSIYSGLAATAVLACCLTARADITLDTGPTGAVVVVDLDDATPYEVPVCTSDGSTDPAGRLGTCITPPIGPTGPTGPPGPTGAMGFVAQVRAFSAPTGVVAGTVQNVNIVCENDQVVSGGGFTIDATDPADYPKVHIISSVAGFPGIWKVDFTSTGPLNDAVTVLAHAVCTDPAP